MPCVPARPAIGHDLLEQVEARLRAEFGHIEIDTHLEPIEDPRSYENGTVPPLSAGPGR